MINFAPETLVYINKTILERQAKAIGLSLADDRTIIVATYILAPQTFLLELLIEVSFHNFSILENIFTATRRKP